MMDIKKAIATTALEGGIFWKSVDIPLEKEGFYVVAIFDESGKLMEHSGEHDWISFKEYCNGRLSPNGEYEYGGLHGRPTHYMSREDFETLLGIVPKVNKDGEIII